MRTIQIQTKEKLPDELFHRFLNGLRKGKEYHKYTQNLDHYEYIGMNVEGAVIEDIYGDDINLEITYDYDVEKETLTCYNAIVSDDACEVLNYVLSDEQYKTLSNELYKTLI